MDDYPLIYCERCGKSGYTVPPAVHRCATTVTTKEHGERWINRCDGCGWTATYATNKTAGRYAAQHLTRNH